MNITAESQSASVTAVQGGISAMFVAYLQDALAIILPYSLLAVALIVADLIFGIAASRKRGEEIRVSRAARRTMDKFVSYLCWLIIAAFCTVTFEADWLDKVILGFVMLIEGYSVVTNFLYLRHKRIEGVDKYILKVIGDRTHTDTSDLEIKDTEKTQKK